jgi:hypothetical protein
MTTAEVVPWLQAIEDELMDLSEERGLQSCSAGLLEEVVRQAVPEATAREVAAYVGHVFEPGTHWTHTYALDTCREPLLDGLQCTVRGVCMLSKWSQYPCTLRHAHDLREVHWQRTQYSCALLNAHKLSEVHGQGTRYICAVFHAQYSYEVHCRGPSTYAQ